MATEEYSISGEKLISTVKELIRETNVRHIIIPVMASTERPATRSLDLPEHLACRLLPYKP